MKNKALILVGVFSFLLLLNASAQSVALTKQEKLGKNKLWGLYKYIQETSFEKLSQEKLFNKYVTFYSFTEDSAQSIDPRRKEIFTRQLKNLDSRLDTIKIKELDALPWNKFAHPDNLPRMLWQDEPMTHLFGEPLANKSKDREKVVDEGKKQLENTWVIFEKDSPSIPRYFVLFDEKANKIVSWTLINQGGLHYFLPF